MNETTGLIRHAEATLLQAELCAGADREALIVEAKDVLIRVESMQPGHGSWLMACIHARVDNEVLCRKWLARAHAAGRLPQREAMVASPYFRSVREQGWFLRFLEGLEE